MHHNYDHKTIKKRKSHKLKKQTSAIMCLKYGGLVPYCWFEASTSKNVCVPHTHTNIPTAWLCNHDDATLLASTCSWQPTNDHVRAKESASFYSLFESPCSTCDACVGVFGDKTVRSKGKKSQMPHASYMTKETKN